MLTNFVRDGIWSLEEGIYQMTGKNAQQWGMKERGTLVPGFAADLVLLDMDALATLEDVPNEYREDVPGGQSRYYRPSRGFEQVWVNGALVYTEAEGYVEGVEGVGQIV